MTKATSNWEPSCEKMTPGKGGILNGDVTKFLLLKDGGRYKCQFHTVHKYVILFCTYKEIFSCQRTSFESPFTEFMNITLRI